MAARGWMGAGTYRGMTRERARWLGGFIRCRAIPRRDLRIRFWPRRRRLGVDSGGNTAAAERCGIRWCTIRSWICFLSAWAMAALGIPATAARMAAIIYLLVRS